MKELIDYLEYVWMTFLVGVLVTITATPFVWFFYNNGPQPAFGLPHLTFLHTWGTLMTLYLVRQCVNLYKHKKS